MVSAQGCSEVGDRDRSWRYTDADNEYVEAPSQQCAAEIIHLPEMYDAPHIGLPHLSSATSHGTLKGVAGLPPTIRVLTSPASAN